MLTDRSSSSYSFISRFCVYSRFPPTSLKAALPAKSKSMKLIKPHVITLVSYIVTVRANTQAFFEQKILDASQRVLGESTAPSRPVSNFTRMSLSSIGTSEFTTLSHPDFPFHSVRIKKAPKDWCDPSVDKYTGYIDISLHDIYGSISLNLGGRQKATLSFCGRMVVQALLALLHFSSS